MGALARLNLELWFDLYFGAEETEADEEGVAPDRWGA
jgi:hypothetical protein